MRAGERRQAPSPSPRSRRFSSSPRVGLPARRFPFWNAHAIPKRADAEIEAPLLADFMIARANIRGKGMKVTTQEAEKSRVFNKLTLLMISTQDFAQAYSAAAFLLEEVDDGERYTLAERRRFQCYETAMVVAYARPFSMAKGEIGPRKWKDTGLSMTEAERSLHRKLIKYRHTLYAHSDAEFVEMKV